MASHRKSIGVYPPFCPSRTGREGIGSSFEAALLKGVRSLEIKQYTLERKNSRKRSLEELKHRVCVPDDERLFDLAELIRRDYIMEKICAITGMDPFFVNKIKNIVKMEEELKTYTLETFTPEMMQSYKKMGFSDHGIAELTGCKEEEVRAFRTKHHIFPVYKMVDTCAGEFEAVSPYYYATYDKENEAIPTNKKKVLVIGSGPIRIGQGIEFDYCSVHSIDVYKRQQHAQLWYAQKITAHPVFDGPYSLQFCTVRPGKKHCVSCLQNPW